MNRVLRLFLHNMWEKNKGPGDLYVWLFILTLMVAYGSLFPYLVEIFGTTTRVFPALYLAVAALSWGLRGAVPVAAANILLNYFLYTRTGHNYEGGLLGPFGCLFATSLVGTVSDLARQLDNQLRKRQAAETTLKESESRYRKIFNMVSDALFLIDNETGRILEANALAEKMYGYRHDELFQMQNVDVSVEPDDTQLATLEQRTNVPIRYHKKKNGTVFPVEIAAEHFDLNGRRVHVAAVRDISFRLKADEEKKRLEMQFYQAQKMESIGTLAGGIAHDFNNLLGGVMGHASLALMKMTPEDPNFERVSIIVRLAESGEKLTKHLLGFARGGKYETKPANINDIVDGQNLVFGRTDKTITINKTFENDLWVADVDQGQIEQVLFNIYLNAVQAMPGGGGITVTTENVLLEDNGDFAFPVTPGEYIGVSVTDTGPGMKKEIVERVFEPFFTTKEKGVGTGLGMATAYGIIKNHSGYIDIQSEPGVGTTVTLLLPRSDKHFVAASNKPDETIEMGSGTVLIVDDEEDMLDVAAGMVQAMGYVVLTANSGKDAVHIFRSKHMEIDLVLLDVVMPDMDGNETFKRLKEINSDAKVLFQTGHRLKQNPDAESPSDVRDIIHKPFTVGTLSRKIKDVINSG